MTRRTRELLCLFVLFHCTVKAAEEQIVEFSNESDVDPFAESLYTGNIPPFIKPLHYSIILKINMRDWLYSGRVHVLINITEPCDQIPIHSVGLNITDVFVATYVPKERGRRVPVIEVLEDKTEELLRIFPRRLLYEGVYQLFIDFKNVFVSDSFWGFYQSSWPDEKGWENKMVSTQFSPYWARHAWPCFDEPKFKATFKFFVEHESQYYALSNGAVESREPIRAGWIRTTFERTPDMSTYVTAMIITNYREIKGRSQSGTPVKLYGSYTKLQRSRKMLDTTIKSLDFLEDYFGVQYPMSKLDVVPVKRFGVAAMENWGLITAREDIANFDPLVHSAQWELQARVIMAHEVAHMWFGDLVTPHWWDNIILKESTVSWFMVFACDAIFDDFDFSDEYMVTYELIRGMDKDSSVNSRAAITNPEFQTEIMNMFDEITYQRGGNLFRMFYHIVGAESFRAAVHNYLIEKAYGTATMSDMTQYLQDATPEYDIKSLIERYTLQKNFPVVHVRMLNRTHVLVTQERFLFTNKEAVNDSPYNYTWHIPFTYTTDAERVDKVIILTERENIVELNKPATWIKANNDFRMYYITNYDLVGWKKLYHQLISDHTVFTTTDRIQLLSDLLKLVTADKLDITFPLQFLTYMKRETEFGPWKLATEHWHELMNKMSPAEKFAAKIYARDLIDEALKDVVQLNTSFNKPIKERLLQFILVDTGIAVDHPVADEFIDKLGNTSREETAPGLRTLVKTDALWSSKMREVSLQNIKLHSPYWEGRRFPGRQKKLLFNVSDTAVTGPTQETRTPHFHTTYPMDEGVVPPAVDLGDQDEEMENVDTDRDEDKDEEATPSVIMFDWDNMSTFTSPSMIDPLIRERRSSRSDYEESQQLHQNTLEEGTEPGIVYLQKLRKAQTNKNYWNELLETLPKLKDADEIMETYQILCDTNNVTALKELLESSLKGSEDTQQAVLDIISKTRPDIAWQFFRRNYDTYFEKYGDSLFTMSYILQTVTEQLNSNEMYNEVKSFFKTNKPGTGEPGLTAGLEQIAENIRWKKNHRHKCRNFFFTYARKHAKGKN